MKSRKGAGDIRTMINHIDMNRAKTPHGALVTIAAISVEKLRLNNETRRMDSRRAEILKRLKGLEEQEIFLYEFVNKPKDIDGQGNYPGNSFDKKAAQKSTVPLNKMILKY